MELKPPKFCKNAIATNRGWVEPTSGRLIAPCNGLLTRINQLKQAEEKKVIAVEPEIVEQIIDEVEEKPKKLKRKKKNSGEDNNG